jgi:hypothetical protein
MCLLTYMLPLWPKWRLWGRPESGQIRRGRRMRRLTRFRATKSMWSRSTLSHTTRFELQNSNSSSSRGNPSGPPHREQMAHTCALTPSHRPSSQALRMGGEPTAASAPLSLFPTRVCAGLPLTLLHACKSVTSPMHSRVRPCCLNPVRSQLSY